MKYLFTLFNFLLFTLTSLAQSDIATQLVDFNYRNIRLEDALIDVSDLYAVSFAYSKNYIPVDHKISVNVQQVAFTVGLDSLFAEVPVGFQFVGSQIVLKVDREKPLKQRSQPLGMLRRGKNRKETTPSTSPSQRHDVEGDNTFLDWQGSSSDYSISQQIETPSNYSQELRELEYALEQESIAEAKTDSRRNINRRPSQRIIEQQPVAWSVLPFIGSHMQLSDEFTNRWSFNLIWGYNGGVEGFEFGLLGNSIERDVKGLQVAGIGNTVGGNVEAGQVGGIFNYVNGTTKGLQVAGILNSSQSLNGFQASGLTNIVYEYADGFQAAGLGNVVLGTSDAVQFGGVFNANTGRSLFQTAGVLNFAPDISFGQVAGFTNVADRVRGVQLAGIINIADEVNGVQLAGLINVADKVNGVQFGLINMCDSINGVPIGLLNFVRYGYNRFELSGSEAMYLNASVKLGGHRFYNILHTAFRYDEGGISPGAGRSEEMSWALGYGLGAVIPVNRLWHFNIEAISMHVNEGAYWTSRLNLLNQLRFTADVDWNGTSVFFGPTLNVMASKLYDADSQSYGSAIAPYTFYDKTGNGLNPVNTKMWLGFQIGFRW